MNCEQALSAFAGHLDGEELAAGDAAALDVHLAECANCRAQAKELAITHRDLLVLRATEPGRGHREPATVREKREPAAARPAEPVHRHSFWIEAAAAVVLAAILSFLLWPKGRPTETAGHPVKVEPSSHVPASRVGQVAAAEGKVEGMADDAVTPVALKPGAELQAGQEVRVAEGSSAELDVRDGVRVRLGAVSVLRFGKTGGSKSVLLLSGEGHFVVTERDAPWRLQTPNATVESKGGVFVVTVKN